MKNMKYRFVNSIPNLSYGWIIGCAPIQVNIVVVDVNVHILICLSG